MKLVESGSAGRAGVGSQCAAELGGYVAVEARIVCEDVHLESGAARLVQYGLMYVWLKRIRER
jgi:hypothetical protein